jgi:5-methyltetrahydrofolate--homocysteine methyltransferase
MRHSISRQQSEGGAQIIDINMDEGMLDGVCDDQILELIAAEPIFLKHYD